MEDSLPNRLPRPCTRCQQRTSFHGAGALSSIFFLHFRILARLQNGKRVPLILVLVIHKLRMSPSPRLVQKKSRKISNTIPPQRTKRKMPGSIHQQRPVSSESHIPIHTGDIGGLNFCFGFPTASGFPLLAVSFLAYRSLAFRC